MELEFHARFFFFFFCFKFDCPIHIIAFKEPYSRVLNGTRVPYKFFFFYRPIPIATFKEPHSGVLNGTRALWTRVPCKVFFLIFFYLFFLKFDPPILDFLQIKFQNRGISLISLGKGVKCWIFYAKGAKANFLPWSPFRNLLSHISNHVIILFS